MIIRKTFSFLAFSICFVGNIAISQTKNQDPIPDVLRYKANLEPDIEERYIQGDVTISFLLNPNTREAVFNSGSLRITGVIGESVAGYVQEGTKLIISLAAGAVFLVFKTKIPIFQLQGMPKNATALYVKSNI